MRKLWTAIVSGFMEIRYHLLRSSLSLIGIVLGVMNLTAMFSVVQGTRTMNEAIMNSVGTPDLISVTLDWRKRKNAKEKKNFSLGWSDIDNIRRYAYNVKDIGVEVFTRYPCQFQNKSVEYTVIGVLPSTFVMSKYDLDRGRMFNEKDMKNGHKICVVGTTIENEIYQGRDPLGTMLLIGGEYFKVVGVLKMFGDFGEGSQKLGRRNPMDWKNRRILIPATTLQNRFLGPGSTGNWFAISAQANDVDSVPVAMEEIKNVLLNTHDNQDLFQIQSMQDVKNQSEDFSRIWKLVLGFVAGISLMVGGVGIMNVMLASFRERVREIGIRKALGATHADIFLLFIVETVIICVIGGVIGLTAGYFISVTALNAMLLESMPSGAEFSLAAGIWSVVFSVVVGLLAGLYPAFKAARLQPVDALRYE